VLAGTVDVVRKLVPDEAPHGVPDVPEGRREVGGPVPADGGRSYAAALGMRRAGTALGAALLIASLLLLMIVATGSGRTIPAALILWVLWVAAWVPVAGLLGTRTGAKACAVTAMFVLLAQLAATAGLLLVGKGSS
jgi:hypothetical protein